MAKKKKSGILFSLFVILIVVVAAYVGYQIFFQSKISLKDKNYTFIYVKNGDGFDDVIKAVATEEIIENMETFEWLAKKMELDKNIHPGKYRITNGMTTRQIINFIKYNKHEKIKLTYNFQIHNIEEFIAYTDERLEMDATEIEDFIEDEKKMHDYFKLDPSSGFAMIVPGICEVNWAINVEDFFSLLKDRYFKVWNANRQKQAKKIGFSVTEVITIASIVQSESSIKSEQEKIAGVYINRLKKDMLLQADPTLKFANNNSDAQRVLDSDKNINSPYNTYLYKGLPPGPICLTSTQAIDATLNYSWHNYIFFCAKPQLNGFSDFSSTYSQHQRYAVAYQKALDKRGIKR